MLGCHTLWTPIPISREPAKERYPVYEPNNYQGDWPYDLNLMDNLDDRTADVMRAQYGFKRPYYQNTHHYFAIFYLEYLSPDGLDLGTRSGRQYDEADLRDRLNQIRDTLENDPSSMKDPDDPIHRALWNYEAYWIDMHYDLYVGEVASQHARYVHYLGIETLPNLIEEEMCAENESDVWSLQTTVFSGRYEPDSSLTPWWERAIPIPGVP